MSLCFASAILLCSGFAGYSPARSIMPDGPNIENHRKPMIIAYTDPCNIVPVEVWFHNEQ